MLPNSPPLKIAQKETTLFLHDSDIIRNGPKSRQNIWATFVRRFVAKNLQKYPNLVTLLVVGVRRHHVGAHHYRLHGQPRTLWR